MADIDSEIKPPEAADVETKGIPTYGLVKFSDIPDDTRPDIIDIATGAVERYLTDLPAACTLIKETMDRIYGQGWHAVIGENFGFDVTYDTHNLLYMFFNGNLGILIWKCSQS